MMAIQTETCMIKAFEKETTYLESVTVSIGSLVVKVLG
jgi:hypothetical protein